MKSEGLLKGIPDLMVAVARLGYFGLFIEMKRVGVGATTSADQDREIAKLRLAGYEVIVAYGVEEAWEFVCAYLEGEAT